MTTLDELRLLNDLIVFQDGLKQLCVVPVEGLPFDPIKGILLIRDTIKGLGELRKGMCELEQLRVLVNAKAITVNELRKALYWEPTFEPWGDQIVGLDEEKKELNSVGENWYSENTGKNDPEWVKRILEPDILERVDTLTASLYNVDIDSPKLISSDLQKENPFYSVKKK